MAQIGENINEQWSISGVGGQRELTGVFSGVVIKELESPDGRPIIYIDRKSLGAKGSFVYTPFDKITTGLNIVGN